MNGETEIEKLSDKDILLEILGHSREMSLNVGVLKSQVLELEKVKATVKGNGGGIEEGLEFRTLMLEKMESACPGKNIETVKSEILSEFEKLSTKVENHLDTITRLALAEKSEKAGEAKAKEKYNKDGKVIKSVVAEVVTNPKVISALVSVVVGALISLGGVFGVQQLKIKQHKERPAVTVSDSVGHIKR